MCHSWLQAQCVNKGIVVIHQNSRAWLLEARILGLRAKLMQWGRTCAFKACCPPILKPEFMLSYTPTPKRRMHPSNQRAINQQRRQAEGHPYVHGYSLEKLRANRVNAMYITPIHHAACQQQHSVEGQASTKE